MKPCIWIFNALSRHCYKRNGHRNDCERHKYLSGANNVKKVQSFLSRNVKEISLLLTSSLFVGGLVCIVYGINKTTNINVQAFAFVVGGLTLLNATSQFLKSIRDEQTQYGYEMIKDWHSLIYLMNEKSNLFKMSVEKYNNNETDEIIKKCIRDDFQRLLDHMSLILFSLKFERTQDCNELRRCWEETFFRQFKGAPLVYYLWNNEDYKKTLANDNEMISSYENIFI